MANSFLKPEQIAATALGLLERELVLPRLVWTDAVANFAGAKNDTISIRVPAYATSRTRTLRSGDAYTIDDLQENKVDLTLDTDVYKAIGVTDEELTLDIRDFGTQVLQPAMQAVAVGVEDVLAADMSGATYETSLAIGDDDPYVTLVAARKALNDFRVPMSGRVLAVGSSVEAALLRSDYLAKFAVSGGDQSALRDATIGTIAGFTAVSVPGLPPDEGYAFHRSAYVLSAQAPVVPQGVAWGVSRAYQGFALRVIRDYDFDNVRDRLLVNTYMGTGNVLDRGTVDDNGVFTPTTTTGGDDALFVRAVQITTDVKP